MIRWIRDWLGTAPYTDAHDGDWQIIDVRHHVDKSGNSPQALRQSVDAALASYREGKRIVVACDFGISRSNAIAAGILCRAENCSFEKALSDVVASTGETQIKLEMIAAMRAALGYLDHEIPKDVVLVTGGSGFIGRKLVSSLNRTHLVAAPTRSELDLLQGALPLAQYCVRERVGQIIHLAYPPHYTNPKALSESVMMLRHLLDVGKMLDLRLIMVSGWVVFSDYSTSCLLADETLAPRSRGNYGDAKLLEETLLNAYLQRGDVRGVLCRFAPAYGPHGDRPRLIRTFAEAIASGRKVVTHRYVNGLPALDLLHVDDVVAALVGVLECAISGTYHFGTGRLIETKTIAELLSRILCKPLHHEELLIEDTTSNIAMDSSRALQQLGWKPKITIEDGLHDMVYRGALGS